MGIFGSATLSSDEQQDAPAPDANESQFSRGLRSGGYGALSQLNAAVGGVADAVGAKDFAQDRFAASQDYAQQQQANAPSITNFRDVKGVRDAWDYTTGMLGSSIPTSAVALAGALATRGRGGALGAAAGATAATTPMEAGEAMQRIQADPETVARTTPQERALASLGIGATSAAIQSVVPAMVAGQVVKGAGKAGLRAAVGRNLMDIPLEGATEAGGAYAHQVGQTALNPTRDTTNDREELLQAGVGGAVGGAGFSAVGAAADAVGPTARGVGKAVDWTGSQLKAAKGALGKAKTGLEGADYAGMASDASEAASGAAGAALAGGKAGMGAVRQFFATHAPDLTEDVEGLFAGVGKKLEGPVKAVTSRATEVYDRLTKADDLGDEFKTILKEAGADLTKKANQGYVFAVDALHEARKKGAKKTLSDAADKVTESLRNTFGLAQEDDAARMERIARGDDSEGLNVPDDATPVQLEAAMRARDEADKSSISKAASEMLAKAKDPQARKAIMDAVTDLDNPVNRAVIAGFKTAWDANKTAKTKLEAAWSKIKPEDRKVSTETPGEDASMSDALASELLDAISKGDRAKIDELQARAQEHDQQISGGESKPSLIGKANVLTAQPSNLPPQAEKYRKAIADTVVPVLERRHPGLLDNPDAVNKVGEVVLHAVTSAAQGKSMDRDSREALVNLFGAQDTAAVLRALHSALKLGDEESGGRGDAAFYDELSRIADDEKFNGSAEQLVRDSFTPQAKRSVRDAGVKKLIDTLRREVELDYGHFGSAEKERHHMETLDRALQEAFGRNADRVYRYFVKERETRAGKNKLIQDRDSLLGKSADSFEDSYDAVGQDETDGAYAEEFGPDKLGEREADNKYYGANKREGRKGLTLMDHPMIHAEKSATEAPVYIRLREIQKEIDEADKMDDIDLDRRAKLASLNRQLERYEKQKSLSAEDKKEADRIRRERDNAAKPSQRGRKAEMISAAQYAREVGIEHDPANDDKVAIVVRGVRTDTHINEDDFKQLKADSRYTRSKSRIDAGHGTVLDAKKIINLGYKLRKQDEAAYGANYREQQARAFFEGLAAATDYLGRPIEPKNDVRLWGDVTYGDIKRAQISEAPEHERNQRMVDALRKELAPLQSNKAQKDPENVKRAEDILQQIDALTAKAGEKEAWKELTRSQLASMRTSAMKALKVQEDVLESALTDPETGKRSFLSPAAYHALTRRIGLDETHETLDKIDRHMNLSKGDDFDPEGEDRLRTNEEKTEITGSAQETRLGLDARKLKLNELDHTINKLAVMLKQQPDLFGQEPQIASTLMGLVGQRTSMTNKADDAALQVLGQGVGLKLRYMKDALAAVEERLEATPNKNRKEIARLSAAVQRGEALIRELTAQDAATMSEPSGTGRYEVDPAGQIHEAVAVHGRDVARSTDAQGEKFRHSGDRKTFNERVVYDERGMPDRETTTITNTGRKVLDSRGATLERSSVAAMRNQGHMLRWLAKQDLAPEDAQELYANTHPLKEGTSQKLAEAARAERRETLAKLWKKYGGDNATLERFKGAAAATKAAAAPEVAAEGKKSALLAKARSSDPDFLSAIQAHTDIGSLQRTVSFLAEHAGNDEAVARTVDALNAQIKALLDTDPNNAYTMKLLASVETRVRLYTGEFSKEATDISAEFDKETKGKDIATIRAAAKKAIQKLAPLVLAGNKDAQYALNAIRHGLDSATSYEAQPTTARLVGDKLRHDQNVTVGSLMSAIVGADEVPSTVALAKALRKVAGSVPVRFSGKTYGALGVYSPLDNTIEISPNMPDEMILGTVLHESVHAATIAATLRDKELTQALFDLMQHVGEHDPGMLSAYGMTEVGEFLAEGFSNVGFRKRLEAIPASSAVEKYLGKTLANAWESFVGLLRKALGLPEGNTALTQFIELGGRAMRRQGTDTQPVTTSEVIDYDYTPVVSKADLIAEIHALQDTGPEWAVPMLDELLLDVDSISGDRVPLGLASAFEFMKIQAKTLPRDTKPAVSASVALARAKMVVDSMHLVRPNVSSVTAMLVDVMKINGVRIDKNAVAGMSPAEAVDLINKSINADLSQPIAPEVARMLSYMAMGSEYSGQIAELIEGTELQKQLRAEVKRTVPVTYTGHRKGSETVRMAVEKFLSDGLYRRYAKEGGLSDKLFEMLRSVLKALRKALGSDKLMTAQELTDKFLDEVLSGKRPGIDRPSNFVKVNPYDTLKSHQHAANVIVALADSRHFALTGSLAYAAQGTVYRDPNMQVHDLDFTTDLPMETAKEKLTALYPNALLANQFGKKDDSEVATFVVPPKGAKVANFDQTTKDYDVVRDGKIVGTLRHVDGKEVQTGEKAVLVDIMTGDHATKPSFMKVPGFNGDVNVRVSPFQQAMRYKLAYGREKDVRDYIDFTRFSRQANSIQQMTPEQERAAVAEVARLVGDRVVAQIKDMDYAGEFIETLGGTGLIHLSNKIWFDDALGQSRHESLHAMIHQLRRANQNGVASVLIKAASSDHVKKQLNELLKDQPGARSQLVDPEERAAYMFQFWAAGKLTLSDPKTKGVLQRVWEMFKRVLGVWTNDQNAERILEYFNSGEYAKNIGNRDAVLEVAKGPQRPGLIKAVQGITSELLNLAEAITVMGHQRLRNTGIPALTELADKVKKLHTAAGKDHGFISAARVERARFLEQFAQIVSGMSEDEIGQMVIAVQTSAIGAAGAKGEALRTLFEDLRKYMIEAGVDMKSSYGVHYYPRVWDTNFISKHMDDFQSMLDKYVSSGKLKAGGPERITQRLVALDGSEIAREFLMPGMAHLKERELSFITPQDAEPFIQRNHLRVVESYITQATRRAEWARRFDDSGDALAELLDRAKTEGATEQQLDMARDYVRGVDGTLGDTLDPRVRRIMGNMIVYQNIRLLPLMIFSSVVDPMGIMVAGGSVGDAWRTFARGIKEIPSGFKKNPERDESYDLAELMGTIDNAMLTHTVGQLYAQGMVSDTGRKINDTFFRWNLMEQYNTSMRVGATQAAVSFIMKHAISPGKHSARWLAELGIDPSRLAVIDGKLAVTADQYESLGASKEDAAKTAHMIKMAVNQWVDSAILRPDAADRPIYFNDPRFMLMTHLKTFVYSFQQTILNKVSHEMDNGNFRPAIALMSYVPVMIAADFVKSMMQGGGELPEWKKKWTASDYVWSGIQRAGLLGTAQIGMDGIGGVVGPTVEQVLDAVQAVDGRKQFSSLLIEAMPANSTYKYLNDGGSTKEHAIAR